MNTLLEKFDIVLQDLYNHVGFTEDWVIYPIDNRFDMYWKIIDDEVVFHKNKKEVIEMNGNHYCDEIYKQRFYKKHIYKGVDLTMIFVDTGVDNMKYFAFYDNNKEMKE